MVLRKKCNLSHCISILHKGTGWFKLCQFVDFCQFPNHSQHSQSVPLGGLNDVGIHWLALGPAVGKHNDQSIQKPAPNACIYCWWTNGTDNTLPNPRRHSVACYHMVVYRLFRSLAQVLSSRPPLWNTDMDHHFHHSKTRDLSWYMPF